MTNIGTFNAIVTARADKFKQTFNAAGRSVKRFGGGFRDESRKNSSAISRAVLSATKDLNSFERRAKKTTSSVSGSFQKLSRNLRRGPLLGVLGVGGGLLAVDKIIESNDALAKQARVVGINAERYQTLIFAGEKLGISQQQTADGLRRFSRRLGEARLNGGSFAKSFADLGVELGNTTEGALNQAIQGLANIESQSERSAAAARIFGDDSGPRLSLLVSEGTKGLAAQEMQARQLGVTSNLAAANAEKLADSQTDLAQKLRSTVSNAFLENAEGITAIAEAAINAVGAIGKLGSALVKITSRTELKKAQEDLVRATLARNELQKKFKTLDSNFTDLNPLDKIQQLATLNKQIADAQTRITNAQAVQDGRVGSASTLSSAFTGLGNSKPAPAAAITPVKSELKARETALQKVADLEAKAREKKQQQDQVAHDKAIANLKREFAARQKVIDQQATGLSRFNNQYQTVLDGFSEANTEALSDLFENSKAFSIAQILISTPLAISRALAENPRPLNFLLAAQAAASGAANLAAVRSQNFSQGGFVTGPGTGTSDSIPARLSNGEFVTKASEVPKNRRLLELMNQGVDIRGIGTPVRDSDRRETIIMVEANEMFDVRVAGVAGNVSKRQMQKEIAPLRQNVAMLNKGQSNLRRQQGRDRLGLDR